VDSELLEQIWQSAVICRFLIQGVFLVSAAFQSDWESLDQKDPCLPHNQTASLLFAHRHCQCRHLTRLRSDLDSSSKVQVQDSGVRLDFHSGLCAAQTPRGLHVTGFSSLGAHHFLIDADPNMTSRRNRAILLQCLEYKLF
jgi:hypothetical protein